MPGSEKIETKENENPQNKGGMKFEDLDFTDDFNLDDFKSENKSKNQTKDNAADLDFAQESQSGDFDADELLNFTSYQNKR